MVKKINNKGFTLIELLATIVLLAIISSITIISITGAYGSSKEKAEEAFTKEVENFVEDYISLNSSKIIFDDNYLSKKKCHNDSEGNRVCNSVKLFPNRNTIGIENVASVITGEDFINPSSEKKCTNSNTKLTIYRDTDFVCCFVIEKENDTSCLVQSINTCDGIFE